MDIGIFVTDFPYKGIFSNSDERNHIKNEQSWGGVGEVCYNLVLELAKRGHNIKVFTTSCTNRNELFTTKNIEIYRFKKCIKLENTIVSLNLFKDPLKYEIEVLHLQGTPTNPGPIAGYIYSKKKGLPFVLSYHRDPVINAGSLSRRLAVYILSKYSYRILNDAKIITATSSEYISQSVYLKNYRNKIRVVPNGINLHEYSSHFSKTEARQILGLPDDSYVVLFVGGLVEHKNPHILINAISIVSKLVPDIRLILVGKGKMLKKLKEIALKLDISANVIFAGFVDEQMKKLYYKAADIFVLPSSAEAFPMVLLEASAFELPLITSDLKCFNTIIKNGYNGLYTRTGDPKDLAEKIIHLLENEEIRKKLGKNARRIVKYFSWEKIAEEFEKIYEKSDLNDESTCNRN